MNSLARLSSRHCRKSWTDAASVAALGNSVCGAASRKSLSENLRVESWAASRIPRAAFSTSCSLCARERPLGKKKIIQHLRDEIRLESESQKIKSGLPGIPGFETTVDGSLLILTKDGEQENVKVTVNVLHSIGREDTYDENGELDESVEPNFVARPAFQVDLQRDNLTMAFRCRFMENIYEDDEDDFQIVQFFTHDGSTDRTQYVALGRLAGPQVYDRLMCLLEDRGIDYDFAKQLQALATAHEHRCYIRSLKDIVDLVSL